MKLNSYILLMMAGILVVNNYVVNGQFQWSKEIFISQGNTPDLVIDPTTGQLHLTAMTYSGVKYIITDKNGKLIHQEMVPGTEQDRGLWKFGASLAIDSHKMPHIGFRDNVTDVVYDVFYTHKTGLGWSTPIQIANDAYRGYVVRVAVDGTDRIHFTHGSITDQNTNTGPVNYYVIQNNKIVFEQHDIMKIRGDERFEIDVTRSGIVELVSGDFSYPSEGGPIYYWRSDSPASRLTYRGDIHSEEARSGANGSPDLFIDATGKVHVCYGVENDNSVMYSPTVRYCRIENGIKIRDIRVTTSGELTGWKIPVGVASLAANEDGTKVVVAYLASENGPLYARLSENNGLTWSEPVELADGWNTADARNKHIVRAYRSNFYVVYPATDGIRLRYLQMTINQPPVAEIGGPYNGKEGSPVLFDASGSHDPDGSIVSYFWDFQKDSQWDDTTTGSKNFFTYGDNFSGMIKLKVMDGDGDVSIDSATVTITNVAPTAEAGGPYTGKWNVNINFNGNATDPGEKDGLTFEWDLDHDGIYETLGQNVSKSYNKGERHKIWLKVKDDDGGVGLDSALVMIANEPPVVSQVPHQSIRKGESFTKIFLDNHVTDPDNSDEQMIWTVAGNEKVNITIVNRIAEVKVINLTWIGSDTVLFIAKDPGDRADTSVTVFSITPSNQPPRLSPIPEQTILENEKFQTVNLDNYVTDPDNQDNELKWTFYGNKSLNITLNDQLLQVAVPDSEWSGSERVTFKVSDPEGLKDSTITTFTVIALNDAPVVTHIPDQRITPGNTFKPISLDDYVLDIDNKDSELTWTAFGAVELKVQIVNRIATVIVPNSDWIGSETIIFYARDPYGLVGNSITTFTVSTSTGIETEPDDLPTEFALYSNFPNPFNPETTIRFNVPEVSHIKIIIYNHLGQKVKTLIDDIKTAGRYQISWQGTDEFGHKVTSGVYFYQLKTDRFMSTKKMMLIM